MKKINVIISMAVFFLTASCGKAQINTTTVEEAFVYDISTVPTYVGDGSNNVIYIDLNQNSLIDMYKEGPQWKPYKTHTVVNFRTSNGIVRAVVSGSTDDLAKLRIPGKVFLLSRSLTPYGSSTYTVRPDGFFAPAGELYFYKVDGLE